MAGRGVLYTPERFQNLIQTTRLAALDLHVFPTNQAPIFPFPIQHRIIKGQIGNSPDDMGHMNVRPLLQAEFSTGAAHTVTATSVKTLRQGVHRLHHIKFADDQHFWDNIRMYGEMDTPNQIHTHNLATNWPGPNAHQLNQNNFFPLALAVEQEVAIRGLWAWHNHLQALDEGIIVESESAVQDQVYCHILHPLNLLLRTRYQHFEMPLVGMRVQYPRWGRASGKVNAGTQGKKKAGYPDFILYAGPARKGQNAIVCEVKNWWSYTPADLESLGPVQVNVPPEMRAIRIRDDTTTEFYWGSDAIPARLIKQIWGELVYCEAFVGFWTNGNQIFLFARTKRNELTISKMHLWTDKDIHHTLFGLSCLGADLVKLDSPPERQVLIDALIPNVGRA
ncbi:hypothetical protein ABKN59_009514 [Abortiporus biennis]